MGWTGNVDALISALDAADGQLLEWQAMAIIDGWYWGPWTHTAQVIAQIHNSSMKIIGAQLGAKQSDINDTLVDAHDLIEAQVLPPKETKKQSANSMGPEQAEKILQSIYNDNN